MKTIKIVSTLVACITFTLTALAQSTPSYIPTNGLVGYWGFNDNANDESGNGNNGTINGATLTTDRFGNINKAYYFNGQSSITVNSTNQISNNINDELSISVWFKLDSYFNGITSDFSPLISKNGPYWHQYEIFVTSTAIGFWGPNIYQEQGINFQFNLNTWYNIIIVFKSGIIKYYLNSVLVGTNTVPVSSLQPSSNSVLEMGMDTVSQVEYLDGSLDDLGIWNRALTQEEIIQLYTSTPAPPTASAQTFCSTATVASIVATGTDLKWYANATGGTPLIPSDTLTTQTYYVSQTLNTIESDRTAVAVTVTSPLTTSAIRMVGATPAIPSVTIGTQTWTAKNLDVATYSDGTVIPQVQDATAWANLTTGAWCYYNNDPATGTTYGKLYNWYAVAGIHDNDPNTPNKKLAPTGYHVSSDSEWTTLTDYLGGAGVAGGKMKESGTTHWNSPNTDATNSSGFTGLPGEIRNYDGTFYSIGGIGYWWSSSEYRKTYAWIRYLSYDYGSANRNYGNKRFGFSVRCLRD
jgi:uncharacterized protein (TIGR02145 family)